MKGLWELLVMPHAELAAGWDYMPSQAELEHEMLQYEPGTEFELCAKIKLCLN